MHVIINVTNEKIIPAYYHHWSRASDHLGDVMERRPEGEA